jgi:hypothetical protein
MELRNLAISWTGSIRLIGQEKYLQQRGREDNKRSYTHGIIIFISADLWLDAFLFLGILVAKSSCALTWIELGSGSVTAERLQPTAKDTRRAGPIPKSEDQYIKRLKDDEI